MFDSKRAHYSRNIIDGETLTTRAAFLNGPDGKEPGVAIFSDTILRYVLREDHAIALCNAIVDSLDEHRTGA
ncbi:hypothetical protein [Arthrobacter sp. Leaf137]|uniref:hypothetical protein n=1 Tax=Arthrobacter sp. Leaf137 TaxID=1736271 RepID=UPI0006FF841B|nr:hypothetical protein [Arthrobacter sp. Leaf137]KQQ89456.1 hypothetical protein ASF64_17615 [Arthrobacter sp. Leaf137]